MTIKSFTLSLLAFVFIGLSAQAQKNFTLEADGAFGNYSFFQAVELYKKAYSKEKSTAEKKRILYQIGRSYYELQDNTNAASWLKKSVLAGHDDPEAQYYLADAIRKQGKFDEALIEFEKFKTLKPSDPRGATGIKSCQLAQEWKDNPTRYLVEAEPLLNSKQFDFSPTWAGKKYDELIFTSTREGSTGNIIDPNTGENFSALWYTKRDKKGKWSVPQLLDETVNGSESNEGSASLDGKFKTLYFTRCVSKKNKSLGCEIYMSKNSGRKWDEPEMIKINKPDTCVVGHPSIGLKDDYLFFASDMPGGKGGKDIWVIKYDKKAKAWGDPINISGINTPGDEMFPFIHDDGRLFFASNGHPGMGGLDIFSSERVGTTDNWGNVLNMKSPINSAANDFGIIFEGNIDRGYLTSDRDGGRGGDDIWSFRIPPIKFIIDGVITDVETGEPIPGAIVKLIGTDGSSVEAKADELGYYEFDEKEGTEDERYISANTSYTMDVTSPGYLKGKGQESTVGIEVSTRFKHDFKLQSIKTKEIRFPEVRYDLARWELQVNDSVNSKDSLDYLYQLLVDNPNIVIELMAHTDTRGSDAANMTLSQKRAESCVEYLASKGISRDRMVAKGYGESEPVISDEVINSLQTNLEKEAAHQKNRRTTFRVLRDDYVPAAPKEEPKTEE
jgi:peptidoglycan-associated lipoprotein